MGGSMLNNSTNPLPGLLRYYRIKLGFTQREVANKLGMSRSGYANYEEGRCLPNIEQVMILSEFLEHDLLFAYSISAQHQKNTAKCNYNKVYENSSYVPSALANSTATEFMQLFKAMEPKEQEVIKKYMYKKKGGHENDERI